MRDLRVLGPRVVAVAGLVAFVVGLFLRWGRPRSGIIAVSSTTDHIDSLLNFGWITMPALGRITWAVAVLASVVAVVARRFPRLLAVSATVLLVVGAKSLSGSHIHVFSGSVSARVAFFVSGPGVWVSGAGAVALVLAALATQPSSQVINRRPQSYSGSERS